MLALLFTHVMKFLRLLMGKEGVLLGACVSLGNYFGASFQQNLSFLAFKNSKLIIFHAALAAATQKMLPCS